MTGTTTTFYVDGVADKVISQTTDSTSATFEIGHDDSTGNYFSGSLSDIRVYNRALNPAEVQTLYNLSD